ncbi:CamS family sex pheromone protein, partial [Staphylococcus aureus]|uniref:CamS family sex pheromone protein n=1 Tax=Staphylococcus aureus TaxID=1280 RepID=UPI001F5BA225
ISWMAVGLLGAVAVGLTGIAFVPAYHIKLEDPETLFIVMSQVLFHPLVGGFLLAAILAADYDENLNNNFKQFNDNLQSYFSNFTQAVGKVKFVDKKPQRLVVDLPIDYYGQAETIGITQYVTEQANKYFDKIDNYEIRIKDGNQPRALISKTKDDKEPQVHIYSN